MTLSFLLEMHDKEVGVMADEKDRCLVLADKHQNMLEALRNLLGGMYESVIMVADRQSLFEAIERVKPDLAIVDLSLPPVDEDSIVYEIKDCYPELKYIILSVHDEPMVMNEVMSAGASGFVLKQSLVVDLFEAVRKVQEGSTFVSGSAKD